LVARGPVLAPVLAVQGLGQDARRGGLAGAARAGEQIGMGDAAFRDLPGECGGDMTLTDDFVEGLGAVLPVERLVFHAASTVPPDGDELHRASPDRPPPSRRLGKGTPEQDQSPSRRLGKGTPEQDQSPSRRLGKGTPEQDQSPSRRLGKGTPEQDQSPSRRLGKGTPEQDQSPSRRLGK